MDARIAQFETHIDYMRDSMAEFRNEMRECRSELKETNKSLTELKTIMERLPTKDDLWSFKIQWLAIMFAAFATIVGGIVGGLDWIKTH